MYDDVIMQFLLFKLIQMHTDVALNKTLGDNFYLCMYVWQLGACVLLCLNYQLCVCV